MEKHVLVVGFARSGAAVANLLLNEGARITVSDPKLDTTDPKVAQLSAKGVHFTTQQEAELLTGIDLIVKNPGIPYRIPLLVAAKEAGIPIVVEVAVAQRYIRGEWIALTGSNGKTTTVEMIASVLRTQANDKHKIVVAGNIGIPVSEVVVNTRSTDTLVTELSSFQLMGMPEVKPHIAIITNIFASHLDYHGTREAYIKAKMNITQHQDTNDYLVLNVDRDEWAELGRQTKAHVVPVSRQHRTEEGAYLKNGMLYYQDEMIMAADALGVPGDHNIENALVAIVVAKLEHINTPLIVQALQRFSGVRHRLQFVASVADRHIYNDSKATDIEATEMALGGFKQPVVLLAGGLDRGDDQMRLFDALPGKVRAMVVFGQTADKLAQVAQKAGIPVHYAEDVQDAVAPAFELSEPGDVILLSPAAASWDQYPDFETRGDLFIQAIEKYESTLKSEV